MGAGEVEGVRRVGRCVIGVSSRGTGRGSALMRDRVWSMWGCWVACRRGVKGEGVVLEGKVDNWLR